VNPDSVIEFVCFLFKSFYLYKKDLYFLLELKTTSLLMFIALLDRKKFVFYFPPFSCKNKLIYVKFFIWFV
jgi:hypothetical protein